MLGIIIESIIISILLNLLILLMYKIIIRINSDCLIGNHDYLYIGKIHGMVVNDKDGGVIGTQMKVYRCGRCGKTKPSEPEDYIGD